MYNYLLYDNIIRSEIELPELRSMEEGEIDITIVEGRVNPGIAKSGEDMFKVVNGNRYYFSVNGVARYEILNGNKIVFEREPGVDNKAVREHLYGVPVRAILLQNGYLVFHSSAILHNGEAVLFAAQSGTGKSTLAAAFNKEGVTLLSDDITPLFVGKDSSVYIKPHITNIRLLPDAAKKLHEIEENDNTYTKFFNKFLIPVEGELCSPIPVKKIFFIKVNENVTSIEVEPLKGLEKLREIVKNMPYWSLLNGDLMSDRFFNKCVQLLNKVDISLIKRPSDKYLLDELVDIIKNELAVR
jgi:hypothetical protein